MNEIPLCNQKFTREVMMLDILWEKCFVQQNDSNSVYFTQVFLMNKDPEMQIMCWIDHC